MWSYGKPMSMIKEEIISKLKSVECINDLIERIKFFKKSGFDHKEQLDTLYGMIRATKELLKIDFGLYCCIENVVDWLLEEKENQ